MMKQMMTYKINVRTHSYKEMKYCNVNESQTCSANWKKPETKSWYLDIFYLYTISKYLYIYSSNANQSSTEIMGRGQQGLSA